MSVPLFNVSPEMIEQFKKAHQDCVFTVTRCLFKTEEFDRSRIAKLGGEAIADIIQRWPAIEQGCYVHWAATNPDYATKAFSSLNEEIWTFTYPGGSGEYKSALQLLFSDKLTYAVFFIFYEIIQEDLMAKASAFLAK